MLTSICIMMMWLVFITTHTMPFSLSISIYSMAFMCMIKSGYSSMTNCSFTGSYGSMTSLSTFLICLNIWIIMMMFLVSSKYKYNNSFPLSFSLSVGALMMIVNMFFYTDNLIMFYIMFELSLIPTLILILKWGYQPERMQAGLYFFMYTICGSLPLLFMIMYFQFFSFSSFMTTQYPFHMAHPNFNSYMFCMALMFAFLIKVPMWGTHLWLPKAHVEAPVSGSMILAGILLKLGGYGLIKMFPLCTQLYSKVIPFLTSINLWGAIAVSMICLYSTDMKSMIAYSSIIHMGIMVVGVLSGSTLGYLGAVLMMISHGFSSPGMFSLANFNYEVTGTRNLLMQKGVSMMHPTSSMLWFIILSSNMAAPPSLNLVSELLLCVSMMKIGGMLFMIIIMTTFFSAAYNLYLYSCQQGKQTTFINFSNCMTSNMMLSSSMHIIPIYLCVFSSFYFCIWS